MRFRKAIGCAAAFAALGLALTAAPASATPADIIQAAQAHGVRVVLASDVSPQAFADCPNGYGCFWIGLNGSSSRWDAPSCGGWVFGSWLNNNVESARNRGGGTIHLYDAGDTVNGYMRSVVNNGVGVNLEPVYRNKTSSIRIDC